MKIYLDRYLNMMEKITSLSNNNKKIIRKIDMKAEGKTI